MWPAWSLCATPGRDFGTVRQDERWRKALQVIDDLGLLRDAAADRGQRPLPPPTARFAPCQSEPARERAAGRQNAGASTNADSRATPTLKPPRVVRGAGCCGSRSLQLEVDMHSVIREQNLALLGSFQDTRLEERVHVSVHAFDIPADLTG